MSIEGKVFAAQLLTAATNARELAGSQTGLDSPPLYVRCDKHMLEVHASRQ